MQGELIPTCGDQFPLCVNNWFIGVCEFPSNRQFAPLNPRNDLAFELMAVGQFTVVARKFLPVEPLLPPIDHDEAKLAAEQQEDGFSGT